MLEIDHLAVVGETLDAATAHVEERLGVVLQPGGKHSVFHTHNTLLGLEDGLYLEAIAADPDAPPPTRPRLFGLDDFAGPPRLANWICRSDAIDVDVERFPGWAGQVLPLMRGDLRWRMSSPDAGRMPSDNLLPYVIQWDVPFHPANRLVQSGVRLRRLTLTHPQADAIRDLLAPCLTDDRLAIATGDVSISAAFDTPAGERLL